jgi:hypothetical protein
VSLGGLSVRGAKELVVWSVRLSLLGAGEAMEIGEARTIVHSRVMKALKSWVRRHRWMNTGSSCRLMRGTDEVTVALSFQQGQTTVRPFTYLPGCL